MIPVLLEEHLEKINAELEKLKQKKLLTTILINKLYETKSFSDIVHKLNNTLKLDTRGKKEYISDELKRIFPGSFGTLITIIYEPFLNIRINDEQSEKLWLELVQVLDDMEDIPDSHPVLQLINNKIEDDLQKYKKQNRELVEKLLCNDEETRERYKNAFVNLIRTLQNDKGFREKYIKQVKMAKDLPQLKEDSSFSKLLAALSPTYAKFIKIQKELKEEADKELGLDSEQFLSNLTSQF